MHVTSGGIAVMVHEQALSLLKMVLSKKDMPQYKSTVLNV